MSTKDLQRARDKPSRAALKIAVLLSGSGTTLENLFAKHAGGELDVDISVVLSSRADALGLERARRRGVPAVAVERKKFKDPDAFSAEIFKALAPYSPEVVVLAGFMCLLPIPPEFNDRVVNIHPALLPAFGGKGFYGQRVHEAVVAQGCKVSGCTVHFVDNEYDHGAILAQKAVPVLPSDTPESLAERVQAAERELYPEVIQALAEGRVERRGGAVILRSK